MSADADRWATDPEHKAAYLLERVAGTAEATTAAMAAYLLERVAEDEWLFPAECKAKREIVESWEHTQVDLDDTIQGDSQDSYIEGLHDGLGDAVRILVQCYAYRSDFPQEWKPREKGVDDG